MNGTPDPFESRKSHAARFCRTSKMSHDHGRHDSCGLRLLNPCLHSILLSLARGMTDVGVGSGALLAVFTWRAEQIRCLRVAAAMAHRTSSLSVPPSMHQQKRLPVGFFHAV